MKDNDLINNALCNRVLKEKAAYAVALFALFVFLHGADMFHFSLCGDELKETMEDIPDIYIAQRRWGIALWKMIFGFGYLPFLNVPIFAAVSVVTIMLQVEILRIRTQTGKCIYGLAFAVCPVWLSLVRISHL